MSATPETATDAIMDLFKATWEADGLTTGIDVEYWTHPQDPPAAADTDLNPVTWIKVGVRHVDGQDTALGRRKITRLGNVTCQIFEPYGKGGSLSQRLAKVAERAFRGKETANGVWFRRVRTVEYGRDGIWQRTDVLAEFQYDDVL